MFYFFPCQSNGCTYRVDVSKYDHASLHDLYPKAIVCSYYTYILRYMYMYVLGYSFKLKKKIFNRPQESFHSWPKYRGWAIVFLYLTFECALIVSIHTYISARWCIVRFNLYTYHLIVRKCESVKCRRNRYTKRSSGRLFVFPTCRRFPVSMTLNHLQLCVHITPTCRCMVRPLYPSCGCWLLSYFIISLRFFIRPSPINTMKTSCNQFH